MNIKNTCKRYVSYFKNNLKKIPLTYNSKEYQRMICGTRLFLGLFAHRRNINLMLFGVLGFAILNIAMWINFIKDIETLSKVLFFISYMILFLILLLMVVISTTINKIHKFKPLKGLITFYRERLSCLVLLFFLIGLLLDIIIDLPLNERINFILYIFPSFIVFSLLRLTMTFRFGLSAFSLIDYAKEQLNNIHINLEDGKKQDKDNINLFRAYYLTIYYAYNRIKKFALLNFGNDVSTILKVNRFPLLASQILFLDDNKKKKIDSFLTEFEKKELIYEPNKFVKLMNEIEVEYKDAIPNYSNEFDFDTLIHRTTYFDYLKIIVTFLLPIITTIAYLYYNMSL
jgi:hypothetical protein